MVKLINGKTWADINNWSKFFFGLDPACSPILTLVRFVVEPLPKNMFRSIKIKEMSKTGFLNSLICPGTNTRNQYQKPIPETNTRNQYQKPIPETNTRNQYQKPITETNTRNQYQKPIPEINTRNQYQKPIPNESKVSSIYFIPSFGLDHFCCPL